MKTTYASKLILTVLLILAVGVGSVSAFGIEPIFFINPTDQQATDDPVSSIHYDLTYVLALAAGFSEEDSLTLQIYDQLVDSEELGPGSTVSYTNCTGSFQPTPDPKDVCSPAINGSDVEWPLWSKVKNPATCTTSAYGPYGPFFHFPHDNPMELGALHDWAWGTTSHLIGYAAYAWDSPDDLLDAKCTVKQLEIINTGMQAGSLQAFATYLHSLGDYYSHQACQQRMDQLFPWGIHTIPTPPATQRIYECDYDPDHPTNTDAHGREFYTNSDATRTDDAIQAIYAQLALRSMLKEGINPSLPLNTVLDGMSGSPTLQQALYNFVHTWQFSQAQERRSYTDSIRQAILDYRIQHPPGRLISLPWIMR